MDVVNLCSDLVKIRSENPPGYTADLVTYLNEICENLGLKIHILKKEKKWNLISDKPTGNLLLCGHIDVVPALDESWDYPPFEGIIADGRIHGRGSTDMKGGCAALLSAMSDVIDEGIEPDADIAFVCDEEGNGDFGMNYLVNEGILHPKACLLAEPTPHLSPLIGEKGILRLHISFRGDSGHASLFPVCGSSAIMQSCKFLKYCDEIHERTWPEDPLVTEVIENTVKTLSKTISCSKEDTRKILANVSYNPGIISGGERVNVIAQRCELDLDMRIPWGCQINEMIEEISDTLKEDSFEVTEKVNPSFSKPGWLCNLVCQGIHSIFQIKALPGVTQAGSDARHLRKLGTEVVMYGPGDLSLLHSVNESISIEQLKKCRDVYSYILRNLPG
jgi:succinyl-diaminopimelate desuccinylase